MANAARRTGRRTKIVATLGPSSSREPMLSRLLAAGVDVVRLNFSHGTHAEHAAVIALVRAAEERMGIPIPILQDLCGPKIRLGAIAGGSIPLQRGTRVVIDPDCQMGGEGRVGIGYPDLARVLRPGGRVLIADGAVELRVEAVEGRALVCRAVRGDRLGEHKGVNLPGVELEIDAVTPRDEADLEFGVAQGVDAIALSFVQRPEEVRYLRARIRHLGGDQMVIAKLERAEAVHRLDAIAAVADGIMIARGDMAVELSPEQVPAIQKRVIARCAALGKPVITATQMLESMVTSSRPTRAEASDVANAILDGSDAVMLSEETAAGAHPLESVRTMHRIAVAIERSHLSGPPLPALEEVGEVARTIASGACRMADRLGARRVVVSTQTGRSARYVSKCRPRTPILAMTTSLRVARRLQFLYGMRTVLVPRTDDIDTMLHVAEVAAIEAGGARQGDRIVVVFGQPFNEPGSTNTLKLHVIAREIPMG